MSINELDNTTELYFKLIEYTDERLNVLRSRLEPMQSELDTTRIRGQIREMKEFKQLLEGR